MGSTGTAVARLAFMTELLRPLRGIVGPPVPIVPFHNWDYYYITQNLTWDPDTADKENYESVTAPRYFVTDLASIPEPFWSALPPTGPYSYPAIIHDWMYWTQPHARSGDDDRAYADGVLKLAMAELKVPALKAVAIYEAVRAFGAGAWAGNADARGGGEKRVLKRVPTDARTTWAEWKQNLDNFA